MFYQVSDSILLINFCFGCPCFSEDHFLVDHFSAKYSTSLETYRCQRQSISLQGRFLLSEGKALRFVAKATRGFRCCMWNYDSQMLRGAATRPWWHLPIQWPLCSSKLPQIHQDLLLHTGALQTFKNILFRKRKKRAWGRDTREET